MLVDIEPGEVARQMVGLILSRWVGPDQLQLGTRRWYRALPLAYSGSYLWCARG